MSKDTDLSPRVRELRKAKGMTQRELAAATHMSIHQVQCVEAGILAARFDHAAKMCAALGRPMVEVFPATKPVLMGKGIAPSTVSGQLARALEEAGLDMDLAEYTFVYHLRGGANGSLQITSRERRRLLSIVRGDKDKGFMVFDAECRRYALNLQHLSFCHFLFDKPYETAGIKDTCETAEIEDDDEIAALVHLAGSQEPLVFDVWPDEASRYAEENPPEQSVQLQDMFLAAEREDEVRLSLTDDDGEIAFFRPNDVAMFSMPLLAVEPRLWNVMDDDDDLSPSAHPSCA